MSATTPRAVLESGLSALNLPPQQKMVDRMLSYLEELQRWNAAYNLTAVRRPVDQVTRHVLDSLSVLPWVAMSLVDVGSGAGLPGLPLAILRTDVAVTLIEGNGKRARFLRHAVRTLALDNVTVVEERAERWQASPLAATVISRAFARLADFLNQTAHLGAVDGRWLAMKGKLDDQELAEVPEGFRIVDIKPLTVPGLAEARHLVIASRA